MIAKRIIGFALLAGMGYMGYIKLEDSIASMNADISVVAFFGLILAIVLFLAVRKVLIS
jgi:hypothetical protein